MVGVLKFLLIFTIFVFVFYLLFLAKYKAIEAVKSLKYSFIASSIAMCFISLLLYKFSIGYENVGKKNNYINDKIVYIADGMVMYI